MSKEADARRRKELAAKGICISCGEAEATLNRDGNMGLRCDPCGEVYSGQKGHVKKKKRRDAKPNAIRYDSDGDAMTYLDSADFASYCKAVLGCISRDMATDMATIKNAMGEAYDVRRHQDALDSLRAIGEIELAWGYRPRYIRTTPRVISTAWNKDQSTTPKVRVPRPDHASLYPREATA